MLTKQDRYELDLHIFGSGALAYPWYQTASVDHEANKIVLGVDPAEGNAARVIYKLTYEQLVDAAQTLLTERKHAAVGDDGTYTRRGLADICAKAWDDCDIDADVADLIIQTACYGDVIFS